MKRVFIPFLILTAIGSGNSLALAAPRALSVSEVLGLAEKTDPSMKAARARITQAESTLEIKKSDYYPRVDIEAIDSTGYPGSSGLLGVGGLMGSPYRSGLGVGAVASMTLFDFGRTGNAVDAARYSVSSHEAEYFLHRAEVYSAALSAFFDCMTARSEEVIYEDLSNQARTIAKEVSRFVKTGQRSIVDRYLSEAQAEETDTAYAAAKERTSLALRRLAILIGASSDLPSCPTLDSVSDSSYGSIQSEKENPLIRRAQSQAEAARSEESGARADFYPKLMAVGSIGNDADTRLVENSYYSAGVGIIIPVFEGLKTRSEVARAGARVLEQDEEVRSAEETIAALDAKFDESIATNRVRLQHLERELTLGHEAFAIAKKRYFSLQGILVDVRDALRNRIRTETEFIRVRAALYLNVGLRKVADGGHL